MIAEKKKVLLLAPSFYSLHSQIIEGLQNLGYHVDFMEDQVQKYNPSYIASSFSSIKKMYYKLLNPNLKYLRKNKLIFEKETYDYFLCINGFSFHPYLLNVLKQNSPQIKCILYLWDGLSLFDFSSNFHFFDSIYTFDLEDSKKHKLKFLPLFWCESIDDSDAKETNVDLFFVGSAHSDRYRILEDVYNQCIDYKINIYVKLVIKNRRITFGDYLRYICKSAKKDPDAVAFVNEYKIQTGRISAPFLSRCPISISEFYEKMKQSRCVLDIEIPCQTGITNRMIKALALNKKIITTNASIKDYPFYDERNILVIDREFPVIPKEFLLSDSNLNNSDSYMESLRLDNWLITLLKV